MQLYRTSDNLQPCPYRGDDLAKVLRFVGKYNLLNDFCGCPHPGDVAHLMSNKLRGHNLAQRFTMREVHSGSFGPQWLLLPPLADIRIDRQTRS
jgi:hypothetical protein